MVIRKASLDDCVYMDSLLTSLIADEAQYDPNLNPAYVVRDNYIGRINLDGHIAFVAEDDGVIIGYVYGFIFEIPNMLFHPTAVLDALYIDPAHRKQGIATRLIQAFRNAAAEKGARRIELKVLSENNSALNLYEKMGFFENKKYMAIDLH